MPRVRTGRAIGFLVAALALPLFGPTPRAADPQAYTVTLKKTGDAALDAALSGSSQLESLREIAPVGPFALVARARQDRDRFQTAMQSFGYFRGQVDIRIDGRPIDDPDLLPMLTEAPANPPAAVIATFDPGPQFHIRSVTVLGQVPQSAIAALNLKPGAPAVAADVLAAQDRLLTALRDQSYALAKVELQPATVRLPDQTMDIVFHVSTGPRVDIGPIAFQGLDGVNASFVRRRLSLHPGQPFSPAAIEAARTDLAALPIFSFVRATPATSLDPAGTLPITFEFGERPLHAVDFGASYSTDLGVGLTAGWRHRNLFGNAEQLNLTAAFQGGGNSTLHPGYRLNAQFIKPDFLRRDQSLEVNVGAIDESLLPYSRKALLQSVVLNRKLSPHWTFSYGIGAEQERIVQENVGRRFNLLMLPLALRYDGTDSLLNPTHGIRAALLLTPTQSLTGRTATFMIAQLSGSTYFDLSGNGRSVVAVRGLVGNAFGADEFSLPPDMRFYAGGSGTVRGYRFQSVGPQFPDGTPIGGTQITAAGAELRQRFLQNWGFTVFADAAQVRAPDTGFSSKYGIGVGGGLLYFTSIGPIRAQVAFPAVRLPNSGSFELYIGIGQAF
ncbi:MAG: autotransporter assembly complex protein TamA [Acetobacteraceae bacterium]